MSGRRSATKERKTTETSVRVQIDLDGTGEARVQTGIGFFDHMLTAFARHGLFDVEVEVEGDLHIDGHHTVEDTGLVLGDAFREALGTKASIHRFGSSLVPMDESLVLAAVDLSGRPFTAFEGFLFQSPRVGEFDTELTLEFFRSFANTCGCNLHLRAMAGGNAHHLIEAAFKAFARALREAVREDPRVQGVLSTKGSL